MWWEMWYNVIREFYGAIEFWQRSGKHLFEMLEFYNDDRPRLSDITFKDAISYIRRHAYVDLYYNKQFPGKPLFLTQLYLALSAMNMDRLTEWFPVEYRFRPIQRTSRIHYENERWIYRIAHSIAKQGADLKKRSYNEYKYIAKKYNWSYIVNSNDKEY